MTEKLEERVFTLSQMLRTGQRAKRNRHRLVRGRLRAMKKMATKDMLAKRALETVKRAKKQKLAGGKQYSELSPAQKVMISNKLQKIMPRLKKIAKRFLKVKRQQDVARFLQHKKG